MLNKMVNREKMDSQGPVVTSGKIIKGYFERHRKRQILTQANCSLLDLITQSLA